MFLRTVPLLSTRLLRATKLLWPARTLPLMARTLLSSPDDPRPTPSAVTSALAVVMPQAVAVVASMATVLAARMLEATSLDRAVAEAVLPVVVEVPRSQTSR